MISELEILIDAIVDFKKSSENVTGENLRSISKIRFTNQRKKLHAKRFKKKKFASRYLNQEIYV